METFAVRLEGNTFVPEGLPDAKFYVALDDFLSKQIAHYALHKHDLDFVLNCLDEINKTDVDVVRRALWQMAVIRLIKCFDSGTARIGLDRDVIYKAAVAKENFSYFNTLRNKTVVHDENAYTQCVPCAALNDGTKPYKVEKILALAVEKETFDQANYEKFRSLATEASTWVTRKFNELCDKVTADLERQPHEALAARKFATFTIPTVEQVGQRRKYP